MIRVFIICSGLGDLKMDGRRIWLMNLRQCIMMPRFDFGIWKIPDVLLLSPVARLKTLK